MKHNLINTKTSLTKLLTITFILAIAMQFNGCKKDDPKPEDVPELITTAILTFTPNDGGSPVIVTATDPDGEGVQDIKADGPINLLPAKTYVLKIDLINALAKPTDPAYKVTEEVEEEGDEHMFFFAWTNNPFSSPSGDGNIDNRADAVNYTGAANSIDKDKRPLGLTTTWTTVTLSGTSTVAGTFQVLLKHQPNLKSDTSDSKTGETDLDLTFTVNVK
jgi:hypothetical protein